MDFDHEGDKGEEAMRGAGGGFGDKGLKKRGYPA